ncbi:hypothetical protein RAS1_37030 [Phycisphaerae bacterium RAS1]|nr:hypothetical protein RAS1_37030 [Phycisphaerae bacterium RAS1]
MSIPMRYLALLLSCFSAAGCTRVESRVTAYLSHELPFPVPTETSTVAVIAKTTPEEPLLEREVGRKIEALLRQRGYRINPVGEANHVLFAYFAIDSGNTVNGTYNAYVPGGTAYTNVYTSTGQWATATTRLPGRTEQRSYSYTFFTRYLGATLYDHKRFIASTAEKKDDAVVWRATTTSAGSSSDLRSVIDYLLVATFEHFGSDTGKQVRETLGEADKRVKALRESVQAPPDAGSAK